jgi:translation initiation factor 3 subunit A
LKRANELISNKQPHEALELLHDVLVSKKFRTWQKSHETIMCKYLDICVSLKKSRDAKDGLHQYRNITLQQAPASLEVVIKHLINLAESKAENNRKKSSEVALAASTKVDDLEAVHTPESIMLSTMTKEGDAERTDREVLVPWIKFLWDTFRTVLDILRTNSKLEHLYHKTSKKAFAFCKTYERRVEFRRLCEILRNHLTLLQKVGSGPVNVHNKQLRGWEGWTPEAVELHLTTRFEQLQVASEMQSWNEAFHAIEDIHVLIEINKKQPRSQLMAIYYEKLIQIFWVSENYMFHAYASYRFYNLSVTQNRNLTPEQKKMLASAVLLSTLSIPSIVEDAEVEDKLFDFDVEKESNAKIAHLLNFSANPKRANLLAELMERGLLDEVLPELKQLHEILEENFDPFGLVKSAKEVIEKLKTHAELSQYIPCLEKRLVLRLLSQLAAVYRSVKIDFFHELLGDVTITSKEIEQLVVRSVKGRQLILRVDHMNGGWVGEREEEEGRGGRYVG